MNSFYERIKEFYPSKFGARTLYHYTRQDVLGVFLRDDARLFCTDVDQLNDEAEFAIGVDYGLYFLKRHYGENSGVYKSVVATIDGLKRLNLWHGWVMSFTDQGDDLGQWRAYTDAKKGGYAIGFDEQSIKGLIERQNDDWHTIELITGRPFPVVLYLYPCFYEDHDDVDRLLNLMFLEFAPEYSKGLRYGGASEQLKLTGTVLSFLQLFASIYKHGSFYAERETRIVIQNQFLIGSQEVSVERVGDKDRIAMPLFPRYVKVRDIIRSVRRSPHGDRAALEKYMADVAQEYGCCYECFKSASPYRA